MAFDIVKMDRGQVWVIRTKSHVQVSGREQDKDRPWVVLSISKFNHTSGMVTCAPITTRDSARTPAQVVFTNLHNTPNVVLCEQIKTFDYKSGDYIFDFVGILSDEVMDRVDKALMVHLGIETKPMSLNRLYESIESFVNSLNYKDYNKSITDNEVIHLAEKIESLVAKNTSNSVKGVSYEPYLNRGKESVKDPVETKNIGYNPGDNIVTKPIGTIVKPTSNKVEGTIIKSAEVLSTAESGEGPSKKERKKATNWTKENCMKFLSDIENLPMKEVMDEWGITRKQGVYTTKKYVKDLLKAL